MGSAKDILPLLMKRLSPLSSLNQKAMEKNLTINCLSCYLFRLCINTRIILMYAYDFRVLYLQRYTLQAGTELAGWL